MKTHIYVQMAVVAVMGLSGAAQAALVDRGGGLIYDSDLDVTWLQNANAALGSIYDGANGTNDGRMTWQNAVAWAASLSYYDSVRNVTYTDWRLPTTTGTGAPGAQCTNSGTDCGYNVDPASSEMAHLYFTDLGNLSDYTPSGVKSGAEAGGTDPYSTLDNVGPFTNFQADSYWSEEYWPETEGAWLFTTSVGSQNYYSKTIYLYALAVRPGDVAAVPEAQTYAMLLAGLGLVGVAVRRRTQSKG